ncbi:MAG: hypothetical protein IPK82_12715 [Polyangiaceae bacterium]|nr:hypothetical protein [Polyangiaceae bacterium]
MPFGHFRNTAPRFFAAAIVCTLSLSQATSSTAQTKPAATSKPAAPKATSSASPGAAPPDAIEGNDEVQRLYMEGDAALKQGAFADAEKHFAKAWSISKSFDIAGALGTAKLELGKYRDAAQYLSYALRNALPSTKPTTRDRIKRDLDKAREHLATIKLTVSLAEASVAIDGASIDPIFLGPEVYIDPGKRELSASANGYTTAKQSVDAKAGEVLVVTLTLTRTTTPKTGAVPTEPPPEVTPWPGALLGAAGAAALIASAGLYAAAETEKNSAYDLARKTLTAEGNPTCPLKGPGPTEQCDKVRSAAANADVFGNTGFGFLIASGALIAAGGVYILFLQPAPPPQKPNPPAATGQLVPVVGPNGGGLIWQGSF